MTVSFTTWPGVSAGSRLIRGIFHRVPRIYTSSSPAWFGSLTTERNARSFLSSRLHIDWRRAYDFIFVFWLSTLSVVGISRHGWAKRNSCTLIMLPFSSSRALFLRFVPFIQRLPSSSRSSFRLVRRSLHGGRSVGLNIGFIISVLCCVVLQCHWVFLHLNGGLWVSHGMASRFVAAESCSELDQRKVGQSKV